MKNINEKILKKLKRNGRGHVFSALDLIDIGSREAIDVALFRLKKENTIRKVMQGIYEYPKISELIREPLPVEIPKVAAVIARKFGWKIIPSGETALNILGISTQVPANYVYISTGRSITYEVSNRKLQFRKGKLKESNFKLAESSLLVQAIHALGKNNLASEQIEKLRRAIDKKKYTTILLDTRTVTGWVYEAIKQICKEDSL